MAEYIDREAALDCFTYESGDMIPETLETGEENTISVKTVKAVLRSIPAADVAPVVHGEWQQTEYPTMSECEDCSECGYRTMYGHGFKFYPNCGARMDGTEEK